MSHLTNMMEQVRKLKNGIGVQALLDEAYKILGNPIVMFNTEYKLMAYTDVATDDPIWNEIIANGTFSKATQELFYNEGFIEELANASKIALMQTDKLKYDRIGGKVFYKNNTQVSNLVIVACNRPFCDEDPIIFEAVCRVLSREISRSELYQEYEQAHQEAIIRSLIDGTFDVKLDMAQAEILYTSLKSNLYAVVVDICGCCPENADIAYCRDLLKHAAPEYKYAVYSNNIVIIISTNETVLNVTKELNALIKVFELHGMYAGISSRFENLLELQKYFAQALAMMQFAMETRSSQRIFPCSESSIHKMEQIQKLENGRGIQYFLDLGSGIFGNPLLFHDMELNLLAYSQNMEIVDPIWEELITYGSSSYETIELFRTEGFIEIMDNTKSGAVLVSDKIKYDRISWRIYNNDNIRIGCTSIVNTIEPFSEDELVLFGAFSQKFSNEVGKIEFYSKYGQVYSETIINRLISGKIDDYTFYSEDIGNLYNDFMDNLYLVVVSTAHCETDQINLTYIRKIFNWPGTVNRYAIYNDYIIIIISNDSAPLCEKPEFKEIGKVFDQHKIYAGVSRCFSDLYELQKYYIEAVGALNEGLNYQGQHGETQIFQCSATRPAGN